MSAPVKARRASHPDWCRGGHACTAGWSVGGEHRSAPLTICSGGRRLVVTLVQNAARPIAEVTVSVALAPSTAAGVARQIHSLIHTLTHALGGRK